MKLFVGSVQLFSDKTAAVRKSTVLVAKSVLAILFNVSARIRQRFVRDIHALAGFLPVFCTAEQLERKGNGEYEEKSVYEFTSSKIVPLESGVRVPADSVGRERRMWLLHESMKVVVGPLQ